MQVTDDQVRAIELSLADAIVMHDRVSTDPVAFPPTLICGWSGQVEGLCIALRTIKGDADTQYSLDWAKARLAQPDADQERANWPMWARQEQASRQQQATWLS